MSRHVRKRRGRIRRRRRYLTWMLTQALEWRLRFMEAGTLMRSSPNLQRLAKRMFQAERVFVRALEQLGVRVTVDF